MQIKEAITTCEAHVKKLENQLKGFYTVNIARNYREGSVEEEADILDEIANCKLFISIYDVLENEGVKEGNTYDEYSAYLSKAREHLIEHEKLKDEIESKNASEIKNINLLLKSFNKQLLELNINNLAP
ncbi:hypothetical protein GCM10010912_29940 [Paenibacillus albidus]|uniref:Uncharacterized protein n=1 Tax=Paenibacillus albidus TaxID=2041023 RepID=A0A917CCD3_9BACL|nr:hypothetical protein [Paenibacillus albidus]GGF82852.1 hypothetical protein GCM10010912_29940 [Paenibacillus albidus]